MTVYQLGQAIMMVGGSLLGAALLEGVGVDRAGYLALFIASSLMRFVAMFLLASLGAPKGKVGDPGDSPEQGTAVGIVVPTE